MDASLATFDAALRAAAGARAFHIGPTRLSEHRRTVRTRRDLAELQGRRRLPRQAARRGCNAPITSAAYHRPDMAERTSAGILLYRRTANERSRSPARAPGRALLRRARPGRLDDPEGRARRPRRAARRRRAPRVRRGDRHAHRPDRPDDPRSARSSRRAARSSTPGRSRATWTRPRRCRTRSRWSGRRGRATARSSPRSTAWAGSIRPRRDGGSRRARSR